MTEIRKMYGYAPISAELLREATEPPDPKDVEQWRAEEAEQLAARMAKHQALLTDPREVVRAVAELHGPVEEGRYRQVCHGCDGHGDDYAEWPCRTWALLAGEEQ